MADRALWSTGEIENWAGYYGHWDKSNWNFCKIFRDFFLSSAALLSDTANSYKVGEEVVDSQDRSCGEKRIALLRWSWSEIADQIGDGVTLSTSARWKYLQFVQKYFIKGLYDWEGDVLQEIPEGWHCTSVEKDFSGWVRNAIPTENASGSASWDNSSHCRHSYWSVTECSSSSLLGIGCNIMHSIRNYWISSLVLLLRSQTGGGGWCWTKEYLIKKFLWSCTILCLRLQGQRNWNDQ